MYVLSHPSEPAITHHSTQVPLGKMSVGSDRQPANRPQRKSQQKMLWGEVRRDTGRGKDRFTFRDFFADER
jgi:hypothetical protein